MSVKRCKRSQEMGMTLLEILIVMSVLSVLAGLFFVVGGRIKEKARQLKCRSHLSQLGLAIKRYRLDHVGGKFPPVRIYEESWIPSVLPYLGSKDLLVCPNDWKLANSPKGIVYDEMGGSRSSSYDYLPRYRIEVFPGGHYVRYSPLWLDEFKKKGDATPLLICPYHAGGDLFLRVSGSVETARTPDWTQW